MKKLLLSSILMLGVCGAVNAQNATGSKLKKNDLSATTTSAAAPTPQKAAVMPPSDDIVAPATKTAADKEAAATAPTAPKTKAQIKAAQASAVTTVNAAGVVVSDEEKVKAEKAQGSKKKQQ